MPKKNEPIMLDGKADRLVHRVAIPTIRTAADAAKATELCLAEYVAASTALLAARAEVENAAQGGSKALAAIADSLHTAAQEREAEATRHAERHSEKTFEVAKLYPALNGVLNALGQYANGEVKIDQPIEYVSGLSIRTFTPEVTNENREAVANFKPLLRALPDTSAIVTKEPPIIEALHNLAAAEVRMEKAKQALADTLSLFDECSRALRLEAEQEADSITEAITLQRERATK